MPPCFVPPTPTASTARHAGMVVLRPSTRAGARFSHGPFHRTSSGPRTLTSLQRVA